MPGNRRFLHDYLRKCTFHTGNNPIEYVNSFVHPGYVISQQLTPDDDILKRRNAFVQQVNDVLCYFWKLKSDAKWRLLQAYCMSMYGCELWLLSYDQLNDLRASWRKSLCRIWGLLCITHSYLLLLINRCSSLADGIGGRLLNFIDP